MKEITDIQELREVQMGILDAMHKYCVDNGINYTISSGTLIGAVRHGGYIPWDDDIDTYMLRSDYERLAKGFNESQTRYRFINFDIDPNCPYPFGKIEDTMTVFDEFTDIDYQMGVSIDVFPLDTVPDYLQEREKLFKKILNLRFLLAVKTVKYSKKRSFTKNAGLICGKILLSPVSRRTLMKKLLNLSHKAKGDWQDVYNYGCGSESIKSCFPKSYMTEFIPMKFEDREYMATKDYDKLLTHVYGDYMELPPEEKRATHHAFKAFWK